MDTGEVTDVIENIWRDVVDDEINAHVPPQSLEEQWDIPGLTETIRREFGADLPLQQWLDEEKNLDEEGLRERIYDHLKGVYNQKREEVGEENMSQIERAVMLQVLDSLWREHLASMDYLRKGIHLRGYAQKDPKNEYKREAFIMFSEMLTRLKHEVVTVLSRGQVRAEISDEARAQSRERIESLDYQHDDAQSAMQQPQPPAAADNPVPGGLPGLGGAPARAQQDGGGRQAAERPETFVRQDRKVGRNESCPCGSGKKYKHCHGAA